MQINTDSRKQSKSIPRTKSSSYRNTLNQPQTAKPNKSNTKPKKIQFRKPSQGFSSEYYQYTTSPTLKPKRVRSISSQGSQRPISSSSNQKIQVSTKIFNQLTSRINLLWGELSTKSQKILGMRLDKTFMQIQILNNQADIHKAQKNHKGSFAVQSIYNMDKQVAVMKDQIKAADANYDSLIDYQRFLTRELEGGVNPSNVRSQKLNTEFMNAMEELRILQASVEKHNQVYQPYIAKLKREINIQKESISDKEQEIKHVNEAIFTHYGKNIRKSKDQMSISSRNSLSSSTRKRNEVQTFYCGNLAVKNRSKVISDKKLLDRDSEYFMMPSQVSPYNASTLMNTDRFARVRSTVRDFSRIFNQLRKINAIQLSMLDGSGSDFGISQAHAQRKELKLEDKTLQCVSTYWQQGALIGIGVEFMRKKKSPVDSLTSQYFG